MVAGKTVQHQQWGVALITALLIVTISTVLVVAMVSRQSFDIQRSATLLQLEQGRLYQMAIEDHAAPLLRRYWEDIELLSREKFDQFSLLTGFGYQEQIENGELNVSLSFAEQDLFNINNLVKEGEANQQSVAQFRRLLEQQEIADYFVDAVIDWLDSDSDITYPDGAEDGYYTGLAPAYRSANKAMVDLSELLLVKGIEPELLKKIAPYITVLPVGSRMNINWMEIPLLMSLHEEITEENAETFVSYRAGDAYSNVDDFLSHDVWNEKETVELKEQLTVTNDYFMITSKVRIGEVTQHFKSLLKRVDGNNVLILKRTRELAE